MTLCEIICMNIFSMLYYRQNGQGKKPVKVKGNNRCFGYKKWYCRGNNIICLFIYILFRF